MYKGWRENAVNNLYMSYKLYLLDLITAYMDYKIDCGSPQTYEVYKLNMQHAQLKEEEDYGNIDKKDE